MYGGGGGGGGGESAPPVLRSPQKARINRVNIGTPVVYPSSSINLTYMKKPINYMISKSIFKRVVVVIYI